MSISNLALENRINSLAAQMRRLQQTVCCSQGTGGLQIVTTSDSPTVTFTGTGTVDDPLIATSIGGGVNIYNSDGTITDALRLVTVSQTLAIMDTPSTSGIIFSPQSNLIQASMVGVAGTANSLSIGTTDITVTAADSVNNIFSSIKLNQVTGELSMMAGTSIIDDDVYKSIITYTGTEIFKDSILINKFFDDGRIKATSATNNDEVVIKSQMDSAIATVPTIYTANGTLSGARVVNCNTNTISFTNTRMLINGAPDDGVSTLKVAGDIVSHGSKFMSTDNVIQCSLIGSGTTGRVGTQSNHAISIITNNTEKVRITTNGRMLIATTTDDGINTLQVNGTISGAVQNGNTAGRPASPITGQIYFDTTLSPAKPIWYNGTAWVDATGTAV